MSEKKIIAWNSNYPLIRTGLAKNTKYVLDYLLSTGKYEIVLYAQGLPWLHGDYQRLPYRVYGCLPNNPQEIQQLNNSDEGTKKAWQYGNGYIEKFIMEVKPDIMVFSDDIWSFPYQDRVWWNKFHTIPHITIDSTPILPQGIDLAKKSPIFTVWSEFAEREMHKLGHTHVKTIPGCIDENLFKRFDKITRLKIREKHDLPKDAFIVGTDSRNQLRKEFPVLLEGFSMFLKQNPDANAYLFLITTHNEGYNLTRYVEEFKIPKERFLALYLCKHCQEIQIRPLQGQDLDCKFCGAQKSQQTIRIDFGCSEEKLNEAYNVFDCISHVFNAAGLELVHIQALYSELPLASVNYAAGEVFCEQPFVSTIDNAWSRQLGTEFRRSIPYPSSASKFYKKIYNMSEEKRAEIGRKGREWAVSKFSPKVVGKQWEDLFDSLPEVNWDYDIKYRVKNDKYPFKSSEFTNDVDFVIDLYQNVLFLENENNGEAEGVKGWVAGLSSKRIDREYVWRYFVSEAQKDNAKNTQVEISSLFDETGRKRGLFVLKESMGDLVILSALFKSFHEQYVGYDLYVACNQQYFTLFEGNELVYKCVPWLPAFENELLTTGANGHKGFVDVVFQVGINTQKMLNYLSNSNPALETNYK